MNSNSAPNSKTKPAPPMVITRDNITLKFEGQAPKLIPRDGSVATKLILEAINNKDYDALPELVENALAVVKKISKGKFEVDGDGNVLVNGSQANPYLSRQILQFYDEGLPYDALLNFVEKVDKNPSHRAVTDLYSFLEKNNHPLTEDGNFIAFKKVRDDFLDCHSGTFDNSPGSIVTMPRNKVDENPNQTCSRGLHVANWVYASNFSSGIMIEVEVNPEHVVAIPTDYNQAKMRVCEYKVLRKVDEAEYRTVYNNYDYDSDVSEEDEQEDYDSWNDHWDDEEEDQEDLCWCGLEPDECQAPNCDTECNKSGEENVELEVGDKVTFKVAGVDVPAEIEEVRNSKSGRTYLLSNGSGQFILRLRDEITPA